MRGAAHTPSYGTISLATGGERPLRRPESPRSPERARRQAVAATPHLPAAPSAAKRRSVHRKNGILQILLWEAQLGSDHCHGEERGRRLLKQQQPLCRSSRSSPLAAGARRARGAASGTGRRGPLRETQPRALLLPLRALATRGLGSVPRSGNFGESQ
ncbi:hypothetical protein GW7_04171 [Heterocephalus glaber]|uniref:Uncharacterized protein n=1 Tax=Heterocephalus glaber TaxID=10181 RepID=G5ALZ0_HETGA|nr:hypothetical protein GW7_04171 [Heterocephalus glaber]